MELFTKGIVTFDQVDGNGGRGWDEELDISKYVVDMTISGALNASISSLDNTAPLRPGSKIEVDEPFTISVAGSRS